MSRIEMFLYRGDCCECLLSIRFVDQASDSFDDITMCFFEFPHVYSTFEHFENLSISVQMKYSEDELAEAARAVNEDALYFRGLDWENSSSKWGHVATPWREHYPDCWNDLFKVYERVNADVIL